MPTPDFCCKPSLSVGIRFACPSLLSEGVLPFSTFPKEGEQSKKTYFFLADPPRTLLSQPSFQTRFKHSCSPAEQTCNAHLSSLPWPLSLFQRLKTALRPARGRQVPRTRPELSGSRVAALRMYRRSGLETGESSTRKRAAPTPAASQGNCAPVVTHVVGEAGKAALAWKPCRGKSNEQVYIVEDCGLWSMPAGKRI